MNQSNENLSIPQGVLTKKLHNLPKSHSNSFFATTFCGWGTSLNKMSSQESNHGGNELLTVLYLKLFHVSWVVVHLIKPCSNVSSKPLSQRLHMPSCPILMHHAPIGSPFAIVNQIMVESFLGSHECPPLWKILPLSFCV